MKSRDYISRRSFLAGCGATAALVQIHPAFAQAKHPNVVLVLVDDVGRGDLACLGNPVVRTPHVDALAAESIDFVNFHVDPTGAPTRAALLTGRYSARLGVWNGTAAVRRLPGDEVTLAAVLADQGYRTGFVGAWQLGQHAPSRPQDHGFQSVFCRAGDSLAALGLPWDTDGLDDTYLRDGTPEVVQGPVTEVWFREAASFLERERSTPHFLFVALNGPWEGPTPSQQEAESYQSDDVPADIALHLVRVARFDTALGGFLARMAAAGLDDNTLLLVLSGNGTSGGVRLYAPDGMLAEDGVPESGFNDNMRGKKGSVYGGGHRVPCFLRLPKTQRTPPRAFYPLVAHIDLVPTLLELCGIRKPRSVKPDGRDLSKLLLGREDRAPDRSIFVVNQSGTSVEKFDAYAVLSDRWRLVGRELFDVEADRGQMSNIGMFQPRVAERILQAYSVWYDAVARSRPPCVAARVGAEGDGALRLTAEDWVGDPLPKGRTDVAAALRVSGYWPVEFARSGDYVISLRRWPEDLDLPLDADLGEGTRSRALPIVRAELRMGNIEAIAALDVGEQEARFALRLGAGHTQLQATFHTEAGERWGAYYVRIERVGD